MMPAQGHTTVWGTHIGVGRTGDALGWYHELNAWWAAYKAARRAAQLAALTARWDATRETVRPLHADAASAMVAPEHVFSTTAALCDLSL